MRHAIEAVVTGESVLDPLVVQALVQARTRQAASPLARLSPRETEVLALVATGLSNSAIAHRRVRAVLIYLSSVT